MTKPENRSEARAYIYQWLAEKYITPIGNEYAHFVTDTLRDALDYLELDYPKPHLGMIEASLTDLQQQEAILEYCRLFYGPHKLPAPPYGSYWLDNGTLMGNSSIKANWDYGKWGLKISPKAKTLPDHICIELEFMYYLAVKEEEMNSAGHYDQAYSYAVAQQEFLANHLLRWIPLFADKVVTSTHMQLFIGLVRFTDSFIKDDFQLLEQLKENYKLQTPPLLS